jgi:hypothetical protein
MLLVIAISISLFVAGIGSSSVKAVQVQQYNGISQCTYYVPGGSTISPQDGRILFPNGTITNTSSLRCVHALQLQTSGWDAYGETTISNAYYTYIQDSWSVPTGPSNGLNFVNGEADAFFDGLQSSNQIVQPALVWGCIQWSGSSCTEGGNYWSIFDEAFQNFPGATYVSSDIGATRGDAIVGSVTRNPNVSFCPFNGPAYSIGVGDSTIGKSVTLTVCTTSTYSNGVVGSLEVVSVSTCADMPGTGSLGFSSIYYTTSPSGANPSYSQGNALNFCTPLGESWGTSHSSLTLTWHYT